MWKKSQVAENMAILPVDNKFANQHNAQVFNSERFWARVRKCDGGGCWNWIWRRKATRGLQRALYSQDNQSFAAARVAWELTNGAIPEGLWVLHKCDNAECVRPEHLFLGNASDNMLDMVAKGRHWKHRAPLTNGMKLITTEQIVSMMRKQQGERTSKDYARELGISSAYLCDIYQGKRFPGRSVLRKLNLAKRIVYEKVG